MSPALRASARQASLTGHPAHSALAFAMARGAFSGQAKKSSTGAPRHAARCHHRLSSAAGELALPAIVRAVMLHLPGVGGSAFRHSRHRPSDRRFAPASPVEAVRAQARAGHRAELPGCHPAALALGQSPPNTVPDTVLKGVLKALVPDQAARADALRLADAAALLREEPSGSVYWHSARRVQSPGGFGLQQGPGRTGAPGDSGGAHAAPLMPEAAPVISPAVHCWRLSEVPPTTRLL